MAYYAANASGNFGTAATWDTGTNTPTLHASTNITVTSGGVNSATYTAPSLVDQATGVLVFIPAKGTAGTIIATLQESGIDTTATASISITSLTTDTWVYLRFGIPYTFTTLVAGSYRIKLNTSGASGTTTVAADSGGSNFAFLATDSRHTVPVSGDDIFIISPNQGSAMTVTVDGTRTCGSRASTSLAYSRSISEAIMLSNKGNLVWDTVSSASLTSRGNIMIGKDGVLAMGTTTTPMPTSIVATLSFSAAADGDHGIVIDNTGEFYLQGEQKTSTSLWKTTYSSGSGTAASPLVVSTSVDWAVNDEIIITPTSDSATNYNETEARFIITKNSATSYVVSSTLGGVESAFSFTHTTDAHVINLTRNVVITSDNTSRAWYFYNSSQTSGDVNIDWARVEYCGYSASNKRGFQIIIGGGTTNVGGLDYSVSYKPRQTGFWFQAGRQTETYTGLVVFGGTNLTSTVGLFQITGTNNKTFTDCFAIQGERSGWVFTNASNISLNSCHALAQNTDNNTNAGGFHIANAVIETTDCTSQCNRTNGVSLQGSFQTSFVDARIGDIGINGSIDVYCVTDFLNDCLFTNSLFGSSSLISNYTEMIPGSEVRFHKHNQTENNHIWYTSYGSARSTGSGLADTTVRTASSLAVRIAPEDATNGFEWSFKVPAEAGSAVSIYGFIQKNSTFGTDDATVELYLPGSTTADDSFPMPDNTSWNVFNLAASYTGTVDAYATVIIRAQSTTSSAYIYVDDLYNGTNVLIGLDLWDEAKPSEIMFEEFGDPDAVWSIRTDTTPFTTAGTAGNRLVKLLRRSEFIALD